MTTLQDVMRVAAEGSPAELEGMLAIDHAVSNAFSSAVEAANWPVVEFLVPKLEHLHFALATAARLGRARAIELLLAAGAPVDGNGDGEPLGNVCVFGKPEREDDFVAALKALLDAGADPNLYKGSRDRSCFLVIAKHGWSAKAATMLLEAGANLHAEDSLPKLAIDLVWEDYGNVDKTEIRKVIDAAFAASE